MSEEQGKPAKACHLTYTENPERLFESINIAQEMICVVAEQFPGGAVNAENTGSILDLWYDRESVNGGCKVKISFCVSVEESDEE
jgi:hypothetical protein